MSKKTTKQLNKERGATYGNAIDHFNATRLLYSAWISRRLDAIQKGAFVPDHQQEEAIRHSVYMVCDKLARSANNVMYADNWDDVAGYSRCVKLVLGLEK